MFGWLPRVAFAAGLALAGAAAGCYDLPRPDCGFACGPEGECPADYVCAPAENRCHRVGAPLDLVCPAIEPLAPSIAPSLVSINPFDDAVDVPTAITPSIRFSESVRGVSDATFRLAEDVTGTPVPAAVSYDAVREIATLTPLQPLASLTRYRLSLSDEITDFDDIPLERAPLSWVFTTRDERPVMLLGRTPGPGATGVAVDATIDLSFSRPVFGVGAGLRLRGPGGDTLVINVSGEASTEVAIFPATQLAAQATHTVEVTDGVIDELGSPVVGAPITWSFETGPDQAPPALLLVTPAPNATLVPVDAVITAVFSEPVTNVTAASFVVRLEVGPPLAGTIAASDGGRTHTFTPTAPLPADTLVVVDLTTAITDLAGNALQAAQSSVFATAP